MVMVAQKQVDFIGYLYESEADAIDAISVINKHFGIPANKDSETKTYTTYHTAKINNEVVYFIIDFIGAENILGEAIKFTIDE
jgi:hypothetical protein